MTKLDSSDARNRTQFAISSRVGDPLERVRLGVLEPERLGIVGLVEEQVGERRVDEAGADAVRPDPPWARARARAIGSAAEAPPSRRSTRPRWLAAGSSWSSRCSRSPPPSRISGIAARQIRNTPSTLTLNVSLQTSSGVSETGVSAGSSTPALFETMSRGPKRLGRLGERALDRRAVGLVEHERDRRAGRRRLDQRCGLVDVGRRPRRHDDAAPPPRRAGSRRRARCRIRPR